MLLLFAYIPLGQSEINHINFSDVLPPADEEIVRFDISVEYSSGVYKFDEFQHF